MLVRHGQSEANVAKRLDTRPPGAPLTQLGHQQARDFGIDWAHPVGLVVHSVAERAVQTAADIADGLGLDPVEVHGIHEVQVGDLEDRSDADAIAQFDAVYDEWQRGVLDVPMPGGETGLEVLDRYLPVLTQTVLLPFKDRIVYDGLLTSYNVSFGPGIRRNLNEDFKTAKDRHGIVTSLPVSATPVGTRVFVDCRGKRVAAQVVKAPFYRRPAAAGGVKGPAV